MARYEAVKRHLGWSSGLWRHHAEQEHARYAAVGAWGAARGVVVGAPAPEHAWYATARDTVVGAGEAASRASLVAVAIRVLLRCGEEDEDKEEIRLGISGQLTGVCSVGSRGCRTRALPRGRPLLSHYLVVEFATARDEGIRRRKSSNKNVC